MNKTEKSIILKPSWKAFLWEYLLGILLIPILIGIYLLWKTYRKQAIHSYVITDHSISSEDDKFYQTIDLANIRQVQVFNIRFNTGSILLRTGSREMVLKGLENPDELKNIIQKAIAAELHRLESEKSFKPRKPKFEAGEMERMDYLTGLWQQGLLSNEEFEEESGEL